MFTAAFYGGIRLITRRDGLTFRNTRKWGGGVLLPLKLYAFSCGRYVKEHTRQASLPDTMPLVLLIRSVIRGPSKSQALDDSTLEMLSSKERAA